MLFEIALVFASLAVVLSAWALLRAYRPPQTRQVLELAAEVADLQTGVDALSARLTKRGKVENMDKARAAHEERAQQRDAITAEAAAIIAQQKQPAAPSDPDALRRALRAKVLQ